jgi:hypothetical protein
VSTSECEVVERHERGSVTEARDRELRRLGVALWGVGITLFVVMIDLVRRLIHRDLQSVARSSQKHEFASAGVSRVAELLWVVVIVSVAVGATLLTRHKLVERSTRWTSRRMWAAGVVVGILTLLGGLVISTVEPIGESLTIDPAANAVVLRDHYLFRQDSSRVVSFDQVVRLDFDEYEETDDRNNYAEVSVVARDGRSQELSWGFDIDAQKAIASRLVEVMRLESRCVMHHADPTDRDEAAYACDFA